MKFLSAVVLASSLAFAAATCPNLCSGHGSCGASDRCTCFPNFQGADCSERVCSYGLAWVDAPSATNTAHWYAECSNKGICDRTSGLCQCYEGYTGKSCRRSTCPNDCSGHGTCYYIEDLSVSAAGNKYVVDYSNTKSYAWSNDGTQAWDAFKIQACVCDPYYEGTDCSLRQCARGDNVLTTSQSDKNVQKLVIDAGAGAATGEITLTFEDLYGGKWETRPIAITGVGATDAPVIEAALEALPNEVIPAVTVANILSATCGTSYNAAGGATGFARCWSITFDDAINKGNQNNLKVNYSGCNRAGCSPLYTGLNTAANAVGVNGYVVDTNGAAAGLSESAICSEHGLCDTTTGQCKCFHGYYLEDCSAQTILV